MRRKYTFCYLHERLFIVDTDLDFISQMADVPRVRVVRYLSDGTPVYGYSHPVSGQAVELGVLGSFDLMTSWL